MVWGGITANGVTTLKQIVGIMTKQVYHTILVRQALPAGLSLLGKGFVFQEDNDPKHSAKLCRNYLQKKEDKGKKFRSTLITTDFLNVMFSEIRYVVSHGLAAAKSRPESNRTDLGST